MGDKISTDLNALENSRLMRSHIRIMLIAGMSFFTDAYDLFIIGVVLLIVKGIFSLTPLQIGILASAALFGAAIGPVIFGYLGDKIGRKYVYWLTITILIIAAVGSAFSFSFLQLFIWRLILGIGIGGDYPLSATIVAEYANKNDRGKLISSTFAMQGFGIIAGAILAVALLGFNVPVGIAWRLLLGAGAIPTLSILYARTKLNETPWYSLYKKGRHLETKSKQVSIVHRFSINFRELWKKNWKFIIGTSASWFLLDISYYGTSIFTPYLATLFGFTGIYGPTLASALILIVAAVPGYWVAVALIDKEGRKPIQAIGFLVMAILFLALFLVGKQLLAAVPLAFFAIYGLTFFFSNYGPNTTTYVYPVELYPTQYRARGHGIAATFGKLGAALSTLAFPVFLASIGRFALLGLLGIVALFGFAFTALLLPETKQRSLSETSGESELLLVTRALNSQFELMQKHIKKGLELLSQRFSGTLTNEEFFARVKQEEHDADAVVHGILDYVVEARASSISYQDISHLAYKLDDIMDGIEAIAARFMIYDIKHVDKNMLAMQKATQLCYKQLDENIRLMSYIQSDPKVLDSIKHNAILASKHENEADELLRSLLHSLMARKDAKYIIKYKEIYEWLESISDRCIDAIDVINDIAVRYIYSRSKR